MTKREAGVVTAYTGILVGDLTEAHKYIEEIMGRPVFTHEMANKKIWETIKEKARKDFLSLKVE